MTKGVGQITDEWINTTDNVIKITAKTVVDIMKNFVFLDEETGGVLASSLAGSLFFIFHLKKQDNITLIIPKTPVIMLSIIAMALKPSLIKTSF
ncbi:MAG: hypothetical protein ACFCUE_09555 [Candidatus Bathyarchaeia archaeon]